MDPIGQQNQGGGDSLDTGTMPPHGNVDPNGLQTTSTGAGALGFAALVGSGHGDALAGVLGLGVHSSPVVTAGLGRLDLFTVGLLLVALSVLLNVASLVIRRQNHRAEVATCEREIERRARLYAERLKGASGPGVR
jgi:hypothetical protein